MGQWEDGPEQGSCKAIEALEIIRDTQSVRAVTELSAAEEEMAECSGPGELTEFREQLRIARGEIVPRAWQYP
ncbi:hypothetical protein [Streptacidiphilus jiangxiensis]|uniref:hypothetical protein n=1 Tax=Streptacidiphilus jiangxiensis TaxID=235985 RepID=UPI000A70121E|nr:hypothetical protein [Streptacidiphilus jiangxiensis]